MTQERTEPNITKQEEIEWQGKEHRVKIEIELEASMQKASRALMIT